MRTILFSTCVFLLVSSLCFASRETRGYRAVRSQQGRKNPASIGVKVERKLGESARLDLRLTDLLYTPVRGGVLKKERRQEAARLGAAERTKAEREERQRRKKMKARRRRFFLLWKKKRRR